MPVPDNLLTQFAQDLIAQNKEYKSQSGPGRGRPVGFELGERRNSVILRLDNGGVVYRQYPYWRQYKTSK